MKKHQILQKIQGFSSLFSLKTYFKTQLLVGETRIQVLDYEKIGRFTKNCGCLFFLVGVLGFSFQIANAQSKETNESILATEEKKKIAAAVEAALAKERAAALDREHKGTNSGRSSEPKRFETSLIDNSSKKVAGYGSMFGAKLISSVSSLTLGAPVVAEVMGVIDGNTTFDDGTIAYGRVDSIAENRISITFDKIKEGDEVVNVSAQALGLDGQLGVEGILDNRRSATLGGSLAANFIAGAAAGLVQTTTGPFGGAVNGGSIRNGLLSGASQTAQETAGMLSREMRDIEPEVTAKAGTKFLLFVQ